MFRTVELLDVLMFKPYKRELHNILEAILSTYCAFANLLSDVLLCLSTEGYWTIYLFCWYHCFGDSWYTVWSICSGASAHDTVDVTLQSSSVACEWFTSPLVNMLLF